MKRRRKENGGDLLWRDLKRREKWTMKDLKKKEEMAEESQRGEKFKR